MRVEYDSDNDTFFYYEQGRRLEYRAHNSLKEICNRIFVRLNSLMNAVEIRVFYDVDGDSVFFVQFSDGDYHAQQAVTPMVVSRDFDDFTKYLAEKVAVMLGRKRYLRDKE